MGTGDEVITIDHICEIIALMSKLRSAPGFLHLYSTEIVLRYRTARLLF